MRIRLLYFALLRERLGRNEETREASAGSTVRALLDRLAEEEPEVARTRPHLQVARNRVLSTPDEALADGDEIALLLPVSGGATLAEVRDAPLDLAEVVRAVSHDGAGGIVSFCGIVRRRSRGRAVVRLEYEAYRAMAEERLRAIAEELAARHGAQLAILHRVGTLGVGETAVVIAASAPHRAPAFEACRDAIERLKVEVPIWKKEIGEDGEEWIGLGP